MKYLACIAFPCFSDFRHLISNPAGNVSSDVNPVIDSQFFETIVCLQVEQLLKTFLIVGSQIVNHNRCLNMRAVNIAAWIVGMNCDSGNQER